MRIIFMGSAPLACPSLEMLLQRTSDEVVAVVTQPDRPKGRNLEVAACPVKDFIKDKDVQILTPDNVNAPDVVEQIRDLAPDVIVVFAYGQILKAPILGIPPKGFLNVHTSLLPAYRGAAPIQWAIANGDTVSGVTTMYVKEELDAGDIILKKEMAIDPEDTAGSFHDKLAIAGAELLGATLDAIDEGSAPRTPQNDSEVTYAPKLKKEDGRIDWTKHSQEIYNRVRGFDPWPGSYCMINNQRLKVLKTQIEDAAGVPGEIIDITGDGPLVGAGAGSIRLIEVQPEGKKAMEGSAYLRGYDITKGLKFD